MKLKFLCNYGQGQVMSRQIELRASRINDIVFKYLSILSFLCFFIPIQGFSQESKLYTEIQEAKKSDVNFKNISVFKEIEPNATTLKEFINPDDVVFFEVVSSLSKIETQAIEIDIPMKNNNMVLELLEVPDYFYDYKVVTSSGNTFPANKNIKSYRGAIKGEANSFAAITFYENEAIGSVTLNGEHFEIAKDKSSGKHVFYNNKNKNIATQPRINCGTICDSFSFHDSTILFTKQSNAKTHKAATPIHRLVRFHVEVDYYTYNTHYFGNVPSLEVFIQGLFNQISLLFENEGILTSVSEMYIWDSYDPNTYPYIPPTLGAFTIEKNRTGINGDLGILVSMQGYQSMAAGTNGLCNSDISKKLAIAFIQNYYYTGTIFSNSVYQIAHELGHLLGSPHTHDCAWNGNNTAIDGCAPVSGGCPQPPYPPYEERTIMSYCDDYDFSSGFGEQPGNLIRYKVSNATCLQRTSPYTYQSIRPNADGILFVKKGGGNGILNNGSSWQEAYHDLAPALQAARRDTSIKQIWVSAGTYYPTTTTDRSISFELPIGVKIYGGFPANADDNNCTTIESRSCSYDPSYSSPSILNGDIGIRGNNTDNSYNVVVAQGDYHSSPYYSNYFPTSYFFYYYFHHLDGFTIAGGNANGYSRERDYSGGGIYISSGCNANLHNLTIENNKADYGGGIALVYAELQNIHIYSNTAVYGGGIYFSGSGNNYSVRPSLKDINIHDNFADYGGGIYCEGDHYDYNRYLIMPSFENISIMNNVAYGRGGGIYSYNSAPIFINALICNNECMSHDGMSGAGLWNEHSTTILIHTTVTRNNFLYGAELESDIFSYIYAYNSIFCSYNSVYHWDDLGGQAQPIGSNDDSYSPCDDQFIDPDWGNFYFRDYNYSIDRGVLINPSSIHDCYQDIGSILCDHIPNYGYYSNFYVFFDDLLQTDLAGNPRVIGNAPDLGAYEYNPNDPYPYYDYMNPFWKNTNGDKKQKTPSKQINPEWKLNVHPNPSKNSQQVSVSLVNNNLSYPETVSLRMYAIDGTIIFSKIFSSGEFTLELPDLAAGIYVVHVQTEKGEVYTQRLVIQH